MTRKKLIVLCVLLFIAVSLWAQMVVKIAGANGVTNNVAYFASSGDGTALPLATVPYLSNGTTLDQTLSSPCASLAQTTVAVSQTASTKLISQAASKKNYICNAVLVAGAAEIVNIVEGTGSTCGTSTVALAGSTTAANGLSLAANGGLSSIGGNASIITGSAVNLDLCLTQSGSSRVSGYIAYVQR